MKDFFDIWLILRHFDFQGPKLAEAISKTFSTRGTNIQSEPTALTASFAEDTAKAAQWRGFIRKNQIALVFKIHPCKFGMSIRNFNIAWADLNIEIRDRSGSTNNLPLPLFRKEGISFFNCGGRRLVQGCSANSGATH